MIDVNIFLEILHAHAVRPLTTLKSESMAGWRLARLPVAEGGRGFGGPGTPQHAGASVMLSHYLAS